MAQSILSTPTECACSRIQTIKSSIDDQHDCTDWGRNKIELNRGTNNTHTHITCMYMCITEKQQQQQRVKIQQADDYLSSSGRNVWRVFF